MKQDKVALLISNELMAREVINKDDFDLVFNYIAQAFGAGYNYGSTEKSNQVPVAQYSKIGRLVKIFDSAKQASRLTGADPTSISKCCKGKIKTAGGFTWKYVNVKSDYAKTGVVSCSSKL